MHLLSIGKREFWYVFLMCSAMGLAFIKTLVFGKCLSPELLGYYSIATTIASYGLFVQCGLLSGLNRELAVNLGMKKNEYCSRLVGGVTILIAICMSAGCLLFFIAILLVPFENTEVRNAFLLGSVLAWSTPFSQIVLLRLRAEQKVLAFSSLQLLYAVAILIGGVSLIAVIGYKGALIAAIAINVLVFIFGSIYLLPSVSYRFIGRKDILCLLKIGIPLMLANVLINLQCTMDRLFMIKFLSPEKIGIYSIGILPLVLGFSISAIVVQYVSPKLLFRFGQGHSIDFVFKRALFVALTIIIGMSLGIPLVKPIATFIVRQWIPAYEESLPLIPLFYIGAIFAAANVNSLVINAANKQLFTLFGAVVVVVLSGIGYLYVSVNNGSLINYAYINVGLQLTSFSIFTGIAYLIVKTSRKTVKESI